jgi:hypothetical protein
LLEQNIPQTKKPIDQFNDIVEKDSILITKLGNSVLEKLYVNAINKNSALNTTPIKFELSTEDSSQCLIDPYKLDSVKIYFVERDFNDTTISEYVDTYESKQDKIKLENAYKTACDDPSEANIINLKKIKNQLDGSKISNTFYFKDAIIAYSLGTQDYPAWLSSDIENSILKHIIEDIDGNTVKGIFEFNWDASSNREGDYFICWTWTVTAAGDQFSSHIRFTLFGDNSIVTSMPGHETAANKYETLLERYTPETYKTRLTDNDLTPDVLNKLNLAVASGFTFLEDLTNQIVDLYNPRVLQEKLLPYLGNFLDVNLKSTDSVLWRRQIINAVPLYKQKGTKTGLQRALDTIGVRLVSLTRLWQVVSENTWQEGFNYNGTTTTFELKKKISSYDLVNFEIYIRPVNEADYVQLSLDYVIFDTVDEISTVTWIGETLSDQPIALSEGDILKVIYKYKDIDNLTEQNLENYIRQLPLQDLRDERIVVYPPKNWNVRLIEESDPLFDLIVPNRFPFHDKIVFGKIRTEFPYSENLYNMEEYNGSIRNSLNPCDIDKGFIDECSSCISTKFNISVEITNLNNDRIAEAELCVREFAPFHAPIHNMTIIGGFNEFVEDPSEYVYSYLKYELEETHLAGEGQKYFHRAMINGLNKRKITRSELASFTEVVSATSGTAYNDSIVLHCDNVHFNEIGLETDGSAILEIISPFESAGTYVISDVEHNAIKITVTEPIDTSCNSIMSSSGELSSCAITFRLINNVLNNSSLCDIEQKNKNLFYDNSKNFSDSNIATQKDVDLGTATVAWTVTIDDYSDTYNILNILPSGELLIDDPMHTLPQSNDSNLTYLIKDELDNTVFEGSIGKLTVNLEAEVTVLNSGLIPITNIASKGRYQKISTSYYEILGPVDGTDDKFLIKGYSDGDVAGQDLLIYNILADNELGYLSYRGLKLEANSDYETSLLISNGENELYQPSVDNNRFKENFIIEIDGNNYFIKEINGNSPSGKTTFTLGGPSVYWKTYLNGGSIVEFTIRRFTKTENITIMGQQFKFPEQTFKKLDRSGNDVVNSSTETQIPFIANSLDGIVTKVEQQESISFEVQYADGQKQEGKL